MEIENLKYLDDMLPRSLPYIISNIELTKFVELLGITEKKANNSKKRKNKCYFLELLL